MGKKSTSVDKSRRDIATAGLRVTSQRAIILDIIKRTEPHLDADSIYVRLVEEEAPIMAEGFTRPRRRWRRCGWFSRRR